MTDCKRFIVFNLRFLSKRSIRYDRVDVPPGSAEWRIFDVKRVMARSHLMPSRLRARPLPTRPWCRMGRRPPIQRARVPGRLTVTAPGSAIEETWSHTANSTVSRLWVRNGPNPPRRQDTKKVLDEMNHRAPGDLHTDSKSPRSRRAEDESHARRDSHFGTA